ncbi:MAG: T9SS type A sorting domain-containing protein [Candidatus Kapaibacterium sp.]
MKSFLLSIIVIISLFNLSYSQSDADKIREELAPKLGQTNMGTDFWFAMPEMFYKQGLSTDNFYLVITSSVNNEVEITSNLKDISIKANIKAGNDTIIRLRGDKYAEYGYQTNNERIITRVSNESGIHVKSKYPISIQTYNSYNGLKDASLSMPTSSLGNEFMLQTYFANNRNTYEKNTFPPSISVTSPFNNTRIELKLSSFNKDLKIRLENGDSVLAGGTLVRILNKGDVWNIFSIDSIGDLSGSLIKASNPVNLQYSHANMSQPLDKGYSNEVHSTIFPTNTWGKIFSIPTFRELNEFPTIRIFALEDETKIYRNGVYWTSINNSTSNEIFESKIWTDRNREDEYGIISPTIITSDKPISVMVFPDNHRILKSNYFELSNLSILTPLESSMKYASFSLFSTHEGWVEGDSARIKKLELYFELNEDNEIPSDLEFVIIDTNNSNIEWKSIKDNYGDSYYSVELNGKSYAAKEILLPDSCNYFIRSNETKFSGYVYKTTMNHMGPKPGIYRKEDFFGFPLATSMNELTSNDTKVPFVTITNYKDDSKVNGIVYDGFENSSKLAQLYMLKEYSSNFDFEIISADEGFLPDPNGNSFIPGEPVQLEFELTKRNSNIDAFAVVYTCDRAGNDTLIFVNEDIFTSVSPEQTLSEYMTVTESSIQILLQAIADGFTELSIFNLEGSKVNNTDIHNQNSIPISSLKTGTYIITLKSDSRLLTRKINVLK